MPGGAIAKLHSFRGVELFRLPVVHDRANQCRGLFGRERSLALRTDFAVDLNGGRKSRRNEEIRGFFLGDPPKQVLHQLDSLIAIHELLQLARPP